MDVKEDVTIQLSLFDNEKMNIVEAFVKELIKGVVVKVKEMVKEVERGLIGQSVPDQSQKLVLYTRERVPVFMILMSL